MKGNRYIIIGSLVLLIAAFLCVCFIKNHEKEPDENQQTNQEQTRVINSSDEKKDDGAAGATEDKDGKADVKDNIGNALSGGEGSNNQTGSVASNNGNSDDYGNLNESNESNESNEPNEPEDSLNVGVMEDDGKQKWSLLY